MLHLQLEVEGGVMLQVTCHHTDDNYRPWIEGTWPNDFTCRCVEADCACREGLHDECGEFGGQSDVVGPECRCALEDGCWVLDWWDATGGELLSGDWPKDASYPIPVSLVGSDEYPKFIHEVETAAAAGRVTP